MLLLEIEKETKCESCALSPIYKEKNGYQSNLQKIENNITNLAEAYNSGDIDRILPFYNYDLVRISPQKILESKAEYAWTISEIFSKYVLEYQVETDEIIVSGKLAFTRGHYKATFRPKNKGNNKFIERRFLAVWKKQEEDWLIFRTMEDFI